jgi:hypothetical protein
MRPKWKLDSVRLEIVQMLMQIGARLAPNVPLAQKSFWTHQMVPLGDKAQVDARFIPYGDSANLDAR